MNRLQAESHRAATRTIRDVDRLVRQSTPTYTWFESNRAVLLGTVFQGYTESRSASLTYLAEVSDAADTPITAYPAAFSEAAVWASIRAMGPAKAADLAAGGLAGKLLIEAMLKQLNGSLYRHVLNGNRNTIHETVDRNRQLVGYRRVSRTGTPCYWCAMLIGRGAVYKSESTATRSSGRRGARRVGNGYHDNDKCGAEPLFRKDIGNYDDTLEQKFSDLWSVSGAHYSGNEAINAFREAYAESMK